MAMRIGFDARRLFNNFTGLGNYSRTLVRNLQHYYPEHEYHLYTSKITQRAEIDYFLDKDKFHIHHYRGSYGFWWRTYGINKDLERDKIDIFHGLSHEIPSIPKQKSFKTIVTFHDLIYEKLPHLFPIADRFFYKRKYRYAAKNADKIIAISKSTATDLSEIYKADKRKLEIVYQSCNSNFQKEFVSENTSSKNEKYFLYVGAITERKGLLKIVEAYHHIPKKTRIPFIVIGSGGKYENKVIEAIKRLGLEKYFIFIDRLENDQLVHYYRKALALVLPSVYEGFGIPVIEALFQKTPVITSNVSSLPEAAGPGGILIDPDNIEALRNAMERMIVEETERNTMAELGYDYVKKHFSSKQTVKRLMGVYKEMTS